MTLIVVDLPTPWPCSVSVWPELPQTRGEDRLGAPSAEGRLEQAPLVSLVPTSPAAPWQVFLRVDLRHSQMPMPEHDPGGLRVIALADLGAGVVAQLVGVPEVLLTPPLSRRCQLPAA